MDAGREKFTALREQILTRLEELPEDRLLEVLDFVEFIRMKTRRKGKKTQEATDNEILANIATSGSLDFYYDDSQDVYTLEDGEPL
ncbi:MAG: DUF2281 domain-containing protein [bacterium]